MGSGLASHLELEYLVNGSNVLISDDEFYTEISVFLS